MTQDPAEDLHTDGMHLYAKFRLFRRCKSRRFRCDSEQMRKATVSYYYIDDAKVEQQVSWQNHACALSTAHSQLHRMEYTTNTVTEY